MDADWLDTFFEDPVLNDRMITDALQPPHIQSEHSYSLANDADSDSSVKQEPLVEGLWFCSTKILLIDKFPVMAIRCICCCIPADKMTKRLSVHCHSRYEVWGFITPLESNTECNIVILAQWLTRCQTGFISLSQITWNILFFCKIVWLV